MAVSAVAARVAASAGASPIACVLAGLAAHSGLRHGGATIAVEGALRSGADVSPWFGHVIYRGDDPRSIVLLDLLRPTLSAARWRPIGRAMQSGEHPSVDLVLAAMAVGIKAGDEARIDETRLTNQ